MKIYIFLKITRIFIVLFLLFFFLGNNQIFALTLTNLTVSNVNTSGDTNGSLNIGDELIFKLYLDSNVADSFGHAYVDIGSLYEDIELNNAGLFGDTSAGDNIWTGKYKIVDGPSVTYGSFSARFIDQTNNLYTIDSSDFITFDAEKPQIENISVTPNPFNPKHDNVRIAYTLTESVINMSNKIYGFLDVSTNTNLKVLVKTFHNQDMEAGDNFTYWWNGLDETGNFPYKTAALGSHSVEDGDFEYYIRAMDENGNWADPYKTIIKVSTLRLYTDKVLISPNPVELDGDGINDWVNFTFNLILESDADGADGLKDPISFEQLLVCGFLNSAITDSASFATYEDTYCDADSSEWPWALIGLNVYDPNFQKIDSITGDILPNTDEDNYYIGIWDEYDTDSEENPPIPSTPTHTAVGDMSAGNDASCMFPLYDAGPGYEDFESGTKDKIFTGSISFKYLVSSGSYGLYTVKAQAELVHPIPTLVTVESNIEYWHFSYEYAGGYVISEPIQATFSYQEPELINVDHAVPSVVSVSPKDGSEWTDPGGLSRVSAYLLDNDGGSGIDVGKSTIKVKDSLGLSINGVQISDGGQTIYWVFDVPLIINGTYTIEVVPVDKRGNRPQEAQKYTFTINIEQVDTGNKITVKGGGIVKIGENIVAEIPPYAVEEDMYIYASKEFAAPYQNYDNPSNNYVFAPISFSPVVNFKRPVKMTMYWDINDEILMTASASNSCPNAQTPANFSKFRIYGWEEKTDEYPARYILQGGVVDRTSRSISIDGIMNFYSFFSIMPLDPELPVTNDTGELGDDDSYITILSYPIPLSYSRMETEGESILFTCRSNVASVKANIFNSAGVLLRTVDATEQPALDFGTEYNQGIHVFKWNLVDANAVKVRNGVYILQLVGYDSDGRAVKKAKKEKLMLVIKEY